MASISFEEKEQRLQSPPDYGFHSIVYVRGTREGYKKVKPQIDNYFASSRLRNKSLEAAKNMKTRYVNLRNVAIDNKKIALTEQEIIKMQSDWVKAIGHQLSLVGSGTEKVGSTLKAIQRAIWTFQKNSAKDMANEILNLVKELEKKFNSLAPEDQKDFIGIVQPKLLEGNIVNIQNGQVIFSRLRETLSRLSDMTENHPYTFFVNMNRELGAVSEVGEIWALNKANQLIEDKIMNVSLKNGKFISTGTKQAKNENGSFSTAKSDAMFTYEGKTSDNGIIFQMGLSLKATSTVIGPNGTWEFNKKRIPKIQIASITGQEKIWNLLTNIYGSSTLMENATLNSLVWGTASSNSVKIIKKDLITNYFERFIAGQGGKLLGNKYDIVDCLIVNGKPIPIIAIIAEVADKLVAKEDSNFVFLNLNFQRENKWLGNSKKKDITLALSRSDKIRETVKNTLKMKVSLNGNILYNFIK